VSEIAILYPSESVRLDPDKLLALHEELGEAGAGAVIARAMDELAQRLAELRPLWREARMTDLAKRARSLIGIADQVGMTLLSRVAGDVARCAAIGDAPALGATLARLDRIGDRSLTAVWDMADMRV
jgi:hypothetical protein